VDLDPYLFLADPLWKSVLAQLFQFAYVSRLATVISVVGIGALLIYASSSLGVRCLVDKLWPPLTLLIIAFATAMLISLVSLSQDFWILPRQWIGSIALASVSVIWLVVELTRTISLREARLAIGALFTSVVLMCAVTPVQSAILTMRDFSVREPVASSELERLIIARSKGGFPPDQVWIDAAQANIDAGGRVDQVFGDFYQARDWREFRLTD
jgi:hypothetical protein